MSRAAVPPDGGVRVRRLAWAVLLGIAMPAAACELDGLSHGYGPMSALFAGAHRYESLNGLDDEAPPPEPTSPPPPPTAPSAPPRSFVRWAKAKPKPVAEPSAEGGSPPSWSRAATPAATPAREAPAQPRDR